MRRWIAFVMASKSYFPSYHSPFSATSSDKVDTSSFSSPPTKTDSCQKKMNRKESNSHPLSPKATTEEVYQHLGLAWPPVRKLRLSEGSSLATARLRDVNFEVSPSQPGVESLQRRQPRWHQRREPGNKHKVLPRKQQSRWQRPPWVPWWVRSGCGHPLRSWEPLWLNTIIVFDINFFFSFF